VLRGEEGGSRADAATPAINFLRTFSLVASLHIRGVRLSDLAVIARTVIEGYRFSDNFGKLKVIETDNRAKRAS